MKKSEIRPSTTYIGDGGELRLVKEVRMDVGGELYVTWKTVGTRHGGGGGTSLSTFAKWAKTIKTTLSADLKHYVEK